MNSPGWERYRKSSENTGD